MKVSPFRWILLVFVILTSLLQGHLIDQIFSEWEYEENSGKWILKIQFDAGYADPVRRYDADVPAPNYEWLVACEPEEWTILQREARRYLGKHLLFKDETTGASLPYEVSFPDWNETPPAFPKRLNGQAYFHVLFVGQADAEPSINIAPGRFPDLVVAEGEVVRTIIGPGESVVASEGNQSLLGGFWVWLVEGFRHVLPLGWDHVLFILGLFLFRREWRPLLLQSLMFTIAHTLTLVMAATGVVRLSGGMQGALEVLIALSLVLVAWQNLRAERSQKVRLGLVFALGLFHGLGFAGALQGFISQEHFLLSVAAMNLGVELAQIVILAVAWVLTMKYFERKSYEKFRVGASVLIGLFGLVWTFDRLLGLF